MTQEPTIIHRAGHIRRGYYRIEDVPEHERENAERAKKLSDDADYYRKNFIEFLPSVSHAIESHQRYTGWRYLPRTGEYRHKQPKGKP